MIELLEYHDFCDRRDPVTLSLRYKPSHVEIVADHHKVDDIIVPEERIALKIDQETLLGYLRGMPTIGDDYCIIGNEIYLKNGGQSFICDSIYSSIYKILIYDPICDKLKYQKIIDKKESILKS